MAELTALESLIEMGFPRGRAEKALGFRPTQGIEAAARFLGSESLDATARAVGHQWWVR